MQSCPVCGRSFDPLGFQVVVPELGGGFCRINCAQRARATAGPGARIAAVPLVALTQPPRAAALAPAAIAAGLRRLAPSLGAVGLLVAGTAAAAILWVRVLGADTTSFGLGPFSSASRVRPRDRASRGGAKARTGAVATLPGRASSAGHGAERRLHCECPRSRTYAAGRRS